MADKQKNSILVESLSGIRGIYGQGIDECLAFKYALAYCKLLHNKSSVLVIGGDSRASTPAIKEAMATAFSIFGITKIIDVGIVPIQVCEYVLVEFKATGGVYITASHNEGNYNGWKFLKKDGAILYKEQSEKLIKKAHSIKHCAKEGDGGKKNVLDKSTKAVDLYIGFVLEKIGKNGVEKIKESNFKILVDPNGGSSIAVLEKLFEKLGVKSKIINNKMGEFNRLIEPTAKSLAYLSDIIDKDSFEFGCGFDCDADRVEIILPTGSSFAKEMGQMVSGQYVLALACDIFLAGSKNQIVVTNDCTSYLVREVIKKYGAKIKEMEVGETNIVKEMDKQKSIIGGEGSSSGVIVPPIKCRDGIMAVSLILKIIADRKKFLGEILENYPRYYSERLKKECLPEKSLKIKKNIEKYFKEKKFKIKKTGGITGGLKILFDENSYLWFRQSKTEPGSFRIIADGDDRDLVNKMLQEGSAIFDKFNK